MLEEPVLGQLAGCLGSGVLGKFQTHGKQLGLIVKISLD